MSMSKYRYTFFEGRGRGELTRLIFVYCGVEFEDVRVAPLDWRKHVATKKFNEAPLLEVDGVTLCQSNAIAHFVARRLNLAGKNDLEEAQCQMIVLTMEDLVTPMFDCYHHIRQDLYPENDESKIPTLKKELEEKIVPAQLSKLELMLKSNNGGDGYFVGDSLTYADLALMHNVTWANTIKINAKLENFPKLKALRDKVAAIPKIAEWNEKWKHMPY